MATSRDKFLWAITLTSSNNKLRVTFNSSSATITVPAGTYYMHNETNATYPSLLKAINTALSATHSAFWLFSATTPTTSIYQEFCGLRLENGTAAFSFDFSHGDWTLDPRILGFPSTQSTDVSSVTVGSSYRISSPLSYYGAWRSWCIFHHRGALGRRSKTVAERYASSTRAADRVTRTWQEDTIRTMEYDWVASGHVYRGRADTQAYAETAQLGLGDTHNCFVDLWDALARDENPVLVRYHTEGNLDLLWEAQDYEAVKLARTDQALDFESVASVTRKNGEFCKLMFDLYVISGSYEY